MSRVLAIALWAILMAAMWLFIAWGQQFKRQFAGLGVEVTRLQMTLITLADILANYWYLPAVALLFACWAVSGNNAPTPRRED